MYAILSFYIRTMTHHTKDKGDLAVSKTITDLLEKGYEVFTPFSEHSKADLIAIGEDRKPIMLQVKYRADGFLPSVTSWSDRNGNHRTKYVAEDFDYFALYLPEVNKVVYPSVSMVGKTIKFVLPKNNGTRFYWYEDYINLGEDPKIRSLEEFGVIIKRKGESKNYPKSKESLKTTHPCPSCGNLTDNFNYCSVSCGGTGNRKVDRPSKEELSKMVWEKPTTAIAADYGVSDKAVEKWCKSYEISKPPRGYWAKQRSIPSRS